MKILIVDDYPANLKLLRAMLEAEQHTVIEAPNGVAALACLERETVDAVISDVLMPAMDGFKLCHEIRQSPRLFALPIILYTSTYNSPTDRELAGSVGADAYILKPAPVNVLLAAIDDARHMSARRRIPDAGPLRHAEVLERYNAVLVRKLETRNAELQTTLGSLRAAHDEILELNRNLETRVAQRTAALDAANRELEAFSFSVSHDLRAPLRHMIGFADLLMAGESARMSDDGRMLCKRILTSASRMNLLIEALLEFARVGRVPLQLVELDLEAVLDEALEAVAPETRGRNIEWRRTRLPQVRGDRVLLRQVLVNLLSNAIKYSRTRSPAIIEIGQRSGRADEVVIYVKDNGVGFDLRQAGEIFGVFKRLHTAESFEGTGIGLANAQRIISRHGGTIWADAAVECGASFFFSLRTA